MAEPLVTMTAFYVRPAWNTARQEREGTLTLLITIHAAQVITSPIQLGWSISNGQSILAHHQIHTRGWVGTRTFVWRHTFAVPGSYVAIGVMRSAGHTQVRALPLDIVR